MESLIDKLNHFTSWQIARFASDDDYKWRRPYDISRFEGNIFVNTGINLLWDLATGAGGTTYAAANCYLGTGTSTTAADATQTDLQTAGVRVIVDSVTTSAQQFVAVSTFTSAVANQSWQEFGTFNASTAGTMLNRKVSDQGTKTSGQTWELTMTITLA